MNSKLEVTDVCRQFQIPGSFKGAFAHGNGLIHDTFVTVHELHGVLTRQIVQKINGHVFPHPLNLIENFEQVSRHIRVKLTKSNATQLERRHLSLFPVLDGKPYFIDELGYHWRAFNFIENATAHDSATEPLLIYEAAKAFGLFQLLDQRYIHGVNLHLLHRLLQFKLVRENVMLHVRVRRVTRFHAEFVTEFIGLSAHDHGIEIFQISEVLVYPIAGVLKVVDVFFRPGNVTVDGSSYVVNNLAHRRWIWFGRGTW